MPISNKALLTDIKLFGLDTVINNIDPEQIEDLTIKIICRTIKGSKDILINTLEEYTQEDSDSDQIHR